MAEQIPFGTKWAVDVDERTVRFGGAVVGEPPGPDVGVRCPVQRFRPRTKPLGVPAIGAAVVVQVVHHAVRGMLVVNPS